MSDDSFTHFRQADGRFAKGNPGGPGGNVRAIEMLLNRIWPARRERPVEIEARVRELWTERQHRRSEQR